MTESNGTEYCDSNWKLIWKDYDRGHVIVKPAVCILGCITNIFNFIVFTRKEMRAANPTVNILVALAVTDFLFVLSGLIADLCLWVTSSDLCGVDRAIVNMIDTFCLTFFHSVSIYLTITVGMWRLLGIVRPLQTRRWFTMKSANISIGVAISIGVILIVLMFSTFYVCESAGQMDSFAHELVWFSDCNRICISPTGEQIFNWTHSLLLKIIPCCLLLLITMGIIHGLVRARSRRQKMTSMETESNRTNWMLVIVLIIFLVTEFPTGIFGLLSSILGQQFFWQCLYPMFKFNCFMEYISSATSFFVYLVMAKNYRMIFVNLTTKFSSKFLRKTENNLDGQFNQEKRHSSGTTETLELSCIQIGNGTNEAIGSGLGGSSNHKF